MAKYNREDPRTALPQLEKELRNEIGGVQSDVASLNKRADNCILIQRVTIPSRTYAANSSFWWYTLGEVLPTIDGYTPVGCVGTACNSVGLFFTTVIYPSEYLLYGQARNITASDIAIAVNVFVMYVKDGMWEYKA